MGHGLKRKLACAALTCIKGEAFVPFVVAFTVTTMRIVSYIGMITTCYTVTQMLAHRVAAMVENLSQSLYHELIQ